MDSASKSAEFPKHFDGKRFFNPEGRQAPGLFDLLRWKLTSRPEPSPRFIDDVEPGLPPHRVESGVLRITLVNHSTVILQQERLNLLTDPIWSERASPLTWMGPRRRRNPGISFNDLPPIDAVLISHDHYDHLDLPTLRRLAGRGNTRYIVPIAVGRLLRSKYIGPVHELDWGDSLSLEDCTITSVPAVHFASRTVLDRNRTLWCGYLIACHGQLIYFAGDTGFGHHFDEIRAKFGSPHLALLPIGAYEPRWFMSAVHMAPEEAVRAHEVLGAKTSLGIHHGTFQLADEALDTPREQLITCAQGKPFLVLNNGQFAEIPWP